jgi:aerobic-type carbon monoxide dehydrogenase small subunit (CoxS/CutS family)
MPKTTDLRVNGAKLQIQADPERSLLSVLRDDLDLTGSKYGCGEGQCGACTVLLDGTAVRSCVTPLRAVAGREITTIEGLEKNGRLHPLQQAFLDAESMQCGYCTSGMILSGVALLRSNANPARPEIVRAMQGNVCRCGTYPRISLAVEMAAQRLREERK